MGKRSAMLLWLLVLTGAMRAEVVWFDGRHPVSYSLPSAPPPVLLTALGMFSDDLRQVTGLAPVERKHATVRIVRANLPDDAFRLRVVDGHLLVEGGNGRGMAYGLLELSRLAGVSPWVWWGDVVPPRQERLALPDDFRSEQRPSVQYRGIFLNDEDWSLRAWSSQTYEPAAKGSIGARTYRRIFELLLRLRANTVWPGMHPGTTPFFQVPGAKAVADSCGIMVGTSHCEPMLRNNVGEWDVARRGRFNYRTNRAAVQAYWTERLREVSRSEGNMFTIGMRGIHDSSMEGYASADEQLAGLQQVIDDQQELLRRHVGAPASLMQVFVPYKEVLQLYERGLRVPDYVTLMWCDDNYGYMTRLSNADERKRPGGAGLYYHLSYWGRPHDYLWLSSTQPGLIYNELRQAYDAGVRRLWVANVHDPKVAGYQLELFLDMAWNIDGVSGTTLCDHLRNWLCRQFGREVGTRLLPVMHEYYRLCAQRRPEFMGWSQVELDKKVHDRGLSAVRNTEMTDEEADAYLRRYRHIADQVADIGRLVRPELHDAYFAAVAYPVQAAAAHAGKLLWAQRARRLAAGNAPDATGRRDTLVRMAVARSRQDGLQVQQLTRRYNHDMAGGKWRHSMNDHPRDLPVFGVPPLPLLLTDDETALFANLPFPAERPAVASPSPSSPWVARAAADADEASPGVQPVQMLGHSMRAVRVPRGGKLSYRFSLPAAGDYVLTVALVPTQPSDGGDLCFSVSVDGGVPREFSLKESFRSEPWKQNVLRGQALRTLPLQLSEGTHVLTVAAIDDHLVCDQWQLKPAGAPASYLIPTASPDF